jgi:uridine kinase
VPNVGQLATAGLTLVVGFNPSGKTQFLKDIHSRFLGNYNRDLVVCDSLDVDFADYKQVMKLLTELGHPELLSR